MTVALIHSSLTGEKPAWGFNCESEQVLAVHQIGGFDSYFKWYDMNSRGSHGFVALISHLNR